MHALSIPPPKEISREELGISLIPVKFRANSHYSFKTLRNLFEGEEGGFWCYGLMYNALCARSQFSSRSEDVLKCSASIVSQRSICIVAQKRNTEKVFKLLEAGLNV